jgi:hypothetical protein
MEASAMGGPRSGARNRAPSGRWSAAKWGDPRGRGALVQRMQSRWMHAPARYRRAEEDVMRRMSNPVMLTALIAGLTGSMGACDAPDPEPGEDIQETGMALTSDVDGGTDVAGVRYTITRASCAGEAFVPMTVVVEVDLEDLDLGAVPGLDGDPVAPGGSHHFADAFVTLPAGCYDVEALPLAQGGTPSVDCTAASADGVEVQDGQTTEILLVSQCGEPGSAGGLDIPLVINHPPSIQSLTYAPSKFVADCQTQTLCVTADDPDDDPLELSWQQTSGPGVQSGPTVASTTTNADGSVTQCVAIVPGSPGERGFTVTVYDLAQDPGAPGLIRWEDYFTAIGDPKPSHDSLAVPSYAQSDADGLCAPVCGDSVCNGSESCGTCPNDCGACPPVCGDSVCNGSESCGTCPNDCGACSCTNGCFESDAAGNPQGGGPYDALRVCTPGGGYDFYLCSNALGCMDYPAGCFYGGHHP